MRHIFTFLFALATMLSHAEPAVSNEYVSIDCPKGDITLKLQPDGAYSLELKHWDPKQNRHTRSESLSGRWRMNGKRLVLVGAGELVYERNSNSLTVGQHSASIDGFSWQSSSPSTFADKFTLVERKAVDALLLKAAPR
jgi:hypothetical protein